MLVPSAVAPPNSPEYYYNVVPCLCTGTKGGGVDGRALLSFSSSVMQEE